MPARISLIGQIFGRLKVIADAPKDKHGNRSSVCLCECGTTITLPNPYLKSGDTKSCGCLRRENTHTMKLTHGHSVNRRPSPTLITWRAMISRCTNPKNIGFHLYGGRGIQVCERWTIFENFLEDMGERPSSMTLDRKNNSLGYFKENCKWATDKEQARNARSNRILTVRGFTACLSALCEHFGVDADNVWYRLKKGWPVERAFFEPCHNSRR